MTTLIIGATGATGRLLLAQLLEQSQSVKAVVRDMDRVPASLRSNPNLTLLEGSISDMGETEMLDLVQGCDAVAFCLGHNLTFKGLFGHPRKLVTQATRNICRAICTLAPETPVKVVLMNTTGNRNRDLSEPISFAQTCVIALLRALLPPHVDNEQAADYLRVHVGQHHRFIEWSVVRPDTLINCEETSGYDIHPSPIRSAIFDAGKTSRINVAHFMCALLMQRSLWQTWSGRMPVIYNSEQA